MEKDGLIFVALVDGTVDDLGLQGLRKSVVHCHQCPSSLKQQVNSGHTSPHILEK